MLTLKQLQKIDTVQGLKKIGRVDYDLGHRGGTLGLPGRDVARHFKIDPALLPPNFGAYCNYLGGGIRGTINLSSFSDKVRDPLREKLWELARACKRAYLNLENKDGLNDHTDPDGEINWEARATDVSRAAGVVSAY